MPQRAPFPLLSCLVVLPLVAPIAARPRDVLVVWPEHPTHTLTVLTPDRSRVIRRAWCASGVLYAELLHLFLDGAIRLSVADQRRLLTQSR
jgi:hypothetical protein